jgi:creatinine amidohydrolase
MPKPFGQWEFMHPDELEEILSLCPIAFIPIGTFEHHGWHLPVCFDGVKAHDICLRTAEKTGGVVLPTFFYGTGGGHIGYKWTIILSEGQIRPILQTTLNHLAMFGFKVVVLMTGHYPSEQVNMVHGLAAEAAQRYPGTRFIGLTEPEITSPLPGDTFAGDHAAQYETSLGMSLNPTWVRLDYLSAGRDPARVTLPITPQGSDSMRDPAHPLYAIYGKDPRTTASKALGDLLLIEIVDRLANQVENATLDLQLP